MTEQQLYLAIGVPSFVALVGILVNVGYFVSLSGRFQAVETRIQSLESRLDARMNGLETKFDLLVGRFST